MIVTDRNKNIKLYGSIQLGDTFIYDDIENRWKYYCIQSGYGAIDLMTGKFVEISPFEEVEKVNTELIIHR